MAQRAKIGINGDPLGFDEQLDRIQTPGIGSGSVTWLPEADTRCETLNVTANGTYSAQQAGKYGYDYVTVSVPGSSVTGKDPATGEEVVVRPDPETGEIVKELLPVRIEVTTPPTRTEYTHGETIDYSGIVVHAYSSQGVDMGVVPFNELVFPETTADVQKTDIWSDGQGLNAMMLYLTPKYYYGGDGMPTIRYVGAVIGTFGGNPASYGDSNTPGSFLLTRYNGYNYLYWITGGYGCGLYVNEPDTDGDGKYCGWRQAGSTTPVVTSDKFAVCGFNNYLTNIPESTVDPTTVDPANLHATQSLPVQWSRPQDGAVLETSFNITVTGGEDDEQP